MEPTITTRRWSALRPGHVIICPDSGRPERVLLSRPLRARGHQHVRTDHHDHIRPQAQRVTMAAPGLELG